MRVKLRQLEVFDALLKSGSVTHAAERLNVSQSAVSVALSNLESELGFRLFYRSKGYFAPTSEALLLKEETELGLLAAMRIEQRAAAIRNNTLGVVSVASNGAAAINLLPGIIAEFQIEHPDVQIDLLVRSSRRIASWVAGRQIDIGLIDAPAPVEGLEIETIELPCVCIMRSDDPLAAKAIITPEALEKRTVISITGNHPIDQRLDGLVAEAGVSIRRNVTSSYFAIARSLVCAGAGVALVDVVNGAAPLDDGVVARTFSPRIHFELDLIRPLKHEARAISEEFYRRIRERIETFERWSAEA